MTAKIAMALISMSALAACGESPTALEDGEPMEPFSWFDEIYADMEECSGVAGDFSRARWFGVLNSIQHSDDSLEVIQDPFFTVEWRPPHSIYVGTGQIVGGSAPPGLFVVGVYVEHGALRDILQTNHVPPEAMEACNMIPID